jgi:HNH endonuclease/NUMOD4 motif
MASQTNNKPFLGIEKHEIKLNISARSRNLHKHVETWRPLKQDPTYAISSFGRVYHLGGWYAVSTVPNVPILRVGHYLKNSLDKRGYCRVTINKKIYKVHRLVADAFLLKPDIWDGTWVVDHKDNNKQNNNVGNLQWLTSGDNVKKAFKDGLNPNFNNRGGGPLKKYYIEGKVYYGLAEVLSSLRISDSTLMKRIKSPDFPNWLPPEKIKNGRNFPVPG